MTRPWVEPAEAGCTSNCGGTPPPAPPKYPTLFVHGDHLGSTALLTCYEQPSAMSCGNGSVHRYLRYDAYARMTAYNAGQQLLARGQEGTERTYTGQRWDWQAQVYYYGARFWDPQVARFSALDPVREHMNPYAYVMWRPVMFTDPTGMFTMSFLAAVAAAISGRTAALRAFSAGMRGGGRCPHSCRDVPALYAHAVCLPGSRRTSWWRGGSTSRATVG